MAKKGFEERLIERVAGQRGLNLYGWFWYHTEFWLSKPDRRPYTYIMRDFYHQWPLITLIAVSTIAYAAGRWWIPLTAGWFWVILLSLSVGILLGHLFWGGDYIEGQQEDPPYDPDHIDKKPAK
jgi:hypothetical protein